MIFDKHEVVPQQDAVYVDSDHDSVAIEQSVVGADSRIYIRGKANVLALIDVLVKAAEDMA